MEPLPKVEDLAPKLRGYGIDLPAGVIRVGAFGDSAALSEELLALIRAGRKRGGASLLWAHESDSEPIPSVGDTEIIVNHLNAPSLVTRITEVQVLPFNQIGRLPNDTMPVVCSSFEVLNVVPESQAV